MQNYILTENLICTDVKSLNNEKVVSDSVDHDRDSRKQPYHWEYSELSILQILITLNNKQKFLNVAFYSILETTVGLRFRKKHGYGKLIMVNM